MATWTLQHVENIIKNQVEENLNLDYKASDAIMDKMEIAKDVSAFANSDGGVIIYGVREFNDKRNKHLPEAIDSVVDTSKYTKEWLEQTINSNISPRISGIIITPIRITEPRLGVIYVVEIPKSETAHQANFRYYRRFNFESVPMHDYEIRDIMNRKTIPKIKLGFSSVCKASSGLKEYSTKVYAVNEGHVLANFLKIYLHVPIQLVDHKKLSKSTQSTEQGIQCDIFEFDNMTRDLVGISQVNGAPTPNYSPFRYQPILPGMKIELGEFPCMEHSSIQGISLFAIAHVDNVQPLKSIHKLINADFHETIHK